MAWVLLDDNFPNHPKVAQANQQNASAGWLFVCGLAYCRRYHTGGLVPRAALPSLGAGANPRRSVDALIAVGLWDVSDDGWEVHDYQGFYADEEDKAAKDAKLAGATDEYSRRSAAARLGWERRKVDTDRSSMQGMHASSDHDADAMQRVGEGVGRCSSKLLEEKKREADFAAFWQAYPRKDGKQAARVEWMRLKPTDETQRAIASDLERRGRSSQWLKDGGQFIPHARTYLHQRRWEDGFEERPRLSERTVNVIKGFEDPFKETA